MQSSKPTSLRIEDVRVDLLVPNPDNINEMDPKTFNYLKENMREAGIIDPVQVIPTQDGTYFIMGGEHRWKAARELGYEYIPSVILTDTRWSDADYTDLMSFRMNVLRGNQNPEKFLRTYERMAQKFGNESLQEVFYIADKALWKKLTKNIVKTLRDQGTPDDVVQAVDEAAEKAKTFDTFQKKLTKILSDYQTDGVNPAAPTSVAFKAADRLLVLHVSPQALTILEQLGKEANFSEILEVALGSFVGGQNHGHGSTEAQTGLL